MSRSVGRHPDCRWRERQAALTRRGLARQPDGARESGVRVRLLSGMRRETRRLDRKADESVPSAVARPSRFRCCGASSWAVIGMLGGAALIQGEQPRGCLAQGSLVADCRGTEQVYSHLELPDGFRLVTNGHRVEVTVSRDLVISGTASIVSFASLEARPPGTDGRDAASVRLFVLGKASGRLLIDNRGEPGAAGLEGQPGEPGRSGPEGQPASSGPFWCERGGGAGGAGTGGGPGSSGGPGGDGGDAGRIHLRIGRTAETFCLGLEVSGGTPGAGGNGGRGGLGGPGGPGGRGSGMCGGGTPGPPGPLGPSGVAGEPGEAGDGGDLWLVPNSLRSRTCVGEV
jgi:hypothetical protein